MGHSIRLWRYLHRLNCSFSYLKINPVRKEDKYGRRWALWPQTRTSILNFASTEASQPSMWNPFLVVCCSDMLINLVNHCLQKSWWLSWTFCDVLNKLPVIIWEHWKVSSSLLSLCYSDLRNFICSIDVRCLPIIVGERVDVKEKKKYIPLISHILKRNLFNWNKMKGQTEEHLSWRNA